MWYRPPCVRAVPPAGVKPPVEPTYAPTLPMVSTRNARKCPLSSSASSAVVCCSRPWESDRNDSSRPLIHFTGRPSFSAANSTIAYSGYRPFFMPKPPPTSYATSRRSPASQWNTSFASCARFARRFCALVTRVRLPEPPSNTPTAPRVSIGAACTREIVMSQRATWCAYAKACATASASPVANSTARLPGACCQTSGAPSASAATGSVTASIGS